MPRANAEGRPIPAAPPSVMLIQRMVARHYALERDELMGDRRTKMFAWPRQVAMALSAELTGRSLPAVGHSFARDHTTVLHAIRTVRARCEADADDRAQVDELRQMARLLLAGGEETMNARETALWLFETMVLEARKRVEAEPERFIARGLAAVMETGPFDRMEKLVG